MIALFKTEQAANEFEQKIHNFLKVNRPRYKADKWGISFVDETGIWGVKLPPEKVDTTGVKLEENTCISYKSLDSKGAVTTDETKAVTTKTILTETIIKEPIKEPIK